MKTMMHTDRYTYLATLGRCWVRTWHSQSRRAMRAAVISLALFSLVGCSALSGQGRQAAEEQLLRRNLSVAAAALAAGQPSAARRLYLTLMERFPDAPEPVLGLAYTALQADATPEAKRRFLQAADLATDAPAVKAEALLGAARVSLAQDDTREARQLLSDARPLAEATSSIAWIENGLAVAAALDDDYRTAERHYARALRHSSAHPRISANFVRTLVESGRVAEAARTFSSYGESHWEGNDRQMLRHLIKQAPRAPSPPYRPDPRLLLAMSAIDSPTSLTGDGPLNGFQGLTLLIGGRQYPASPMAGAEPPANTKSKNAPTLEAGASSEAAPVPAPRMADDDVREPAPGDKWLVKLGKSRRLHLNGEASSVAVTVPEIADVQLLSPSVLFIIGQAVGRTSVSVLVKDGPVLMREVLVVPDVEPLRALLAREPGLQNVRIRRLARGVALVGEVASSGAAERAMRLAAASFPEGMLVEDGLSVSLDLTQLRALMITESGFAGVGVQRIPRGVALIGEVGSEVASERALRLATAALPEGTLVENNLRLVVDTEPLRSALAADPEFDEVRVQDLARGVALRGKVGSAAAADQALRLAAASLPEDTVVENNLSIAGPQQVNLEVQIAEVQRSIAEDFGFNWEVFGRSSDGTWGGLRIGRQAPRLEQIGNPSAFPPSIVDGQVSPSLILQGAWNEIGITGMVDALAKAGLANVLARPKVTANSGETASFFSGGEYPLPTGFDDGVIVFEYKKYGVLLDFVPTIVGDGRIELTVRPEVSEPSQDNSVQVVVGVNVPVINVRRAETTVEMGDGESIVIAGLFRSASNEVESGIPVLKDLPLLGGVFGHTSARSNELELIVTVTARLVRAGPAPDEGGAIRPPQTNGYYY